MRIALVLHGWPPESMGGTGLYVQALAAALREEGHELACLSPRIALGPPGVEEEEGGVIRLRLPPPTRWEQTWSRPEADALVRGWLARWRPEVVHVHHLAHASHGLLRAARAEGCRLILTLHDYALPCARGQLVDREGAPCPGPSPERCSPCLREQAALSPATARLGARLQALPALRQALRARAAPAGLPLARVANRLASVQQALALPHRLLSPSADLARRFAELGLRRPERCELPLIRPIPPAPDPGQGPLRLLFASSIIPTKGPDRLLRAFQALPAGAATVSFAGPCPEIDGQPGWAQRLRGAVEATPGARWLGPLPPERLPELLAAHDLLVLPSTWPENSPLIVREASAAGLRLVLPARGGAGELVPEAPRVESEAELLAALRVELARGRGRAPPRRWPSPAAHARWLLEEVYPPGVAAGATGYAWPEPE